MFDEDEETFLDAIPYPEALSRGVIRQGETWKLAANVQYLKDAVAGFEKEHEEAVQAAYDEYEDDKADGEMKAQNACQTAIYRILNTNSPEHWKRKIELFFEELGNV